MKYPYTVRVFQPDAAKNLHRELVVGLFNFLFGSDSSKAMAAFDKYLELSKKDGSQFNVDLKYNGRTLSFWKYSTDVGFSCSVTSK